MTLITFYEQDYTLWLEQTIQDLQTGRWKELAESPFTPKEVLNSDYLPE